MAQTSNIVLRTVDRMWGAVHEFERGSRRFVQDVERRRNRLERQLRSRRRSVSKRAGREVAWLRTSLRNAPLLRGALDLGAQAARGVEHAVSTLVAPLPVASKSEFAEMDRKVAKLNRKVSAVSRKLEALERRKRTPSRRGNGRR